MRGINTTKKPGLSAKVSVLNWSKSKDFILSGSFLSETVGTGISFDFVEILPKHRRDFYSEGIGADGWDAIIRNKIILSGGSADALNKPENKKTIASIIYAIGAYLRLDLVFSAERCTGNSNNQQSKNHFERTGGNLNQPNSHQIAGSSNNDLTMQNQECATPQLKCATENKTNIKTPKEEPEEGTILTYTAIASPIQKGSFNNFYCHEFKASEGRGSCHQEETAADVAEAKYRLAKQSIISKKAEERAELIANLNNKTFINLFKEEKAVKSASYNWKKGVKIGSLIFCSETQRQAVTNYVQTHKCYNACSISSFASLGQEEQGTNQEGASHTTAARHSLEQNAYQNIAQQVNKEKVRISEGETMVSIIIGNEHCFIVRGEDLSNNPELANNKLAKKKWQTRGKQSVYTRLINNNSTKYIDRSNQEEITPDPTLITLWQVTQTASNGNNEGSVCMPAKGSADNNKIQNSLSAPSCYLVRNPSTTQEETSSAQATKKTGVVELLAKLGKAVLLAVQRATWHENKAMPTEIKRGLTQKSCRKGAINKLLRWLGGIISKKGELCAHNKAHQANCHQFQINPNYGTKSVMKVEGLSIGAIEGFAKKENRFLKITNEELHTIETLSEERANNLHKELETIHTSKHKENLRKKEGKATSVTNKEESLTIQCVIISNNSAANILRKLGSIFPMCSVENVRANFTQMLKQDSPEKTNGQLWELTITIKPSLGEVKMQAISRIKYTLEQEIGKVVLLKRISTP